MDLIPNLAVETWLLLAVSLCSSVSNCPDSSPLLTWTWGATQTPVPSSVLKIKRDVQGGVASWMLQTHRGYYWSYADL